MSRKSNKKKDKEKNEKNNWGGFFLTSFGLLWRTIIFFIIGANFVWYSTRCIFYKDSKDLRKVFTLNDLLPTTLDNGDENVFYYPKMVMTSGLGVETDCGDYKCGLSERNYKEKKEPSIQTKLNNIFLNSHGFPYNFTVQDSIQKRDNLFTDKEEYVITGPHAYHKVLGFDTRVDAKEKGWFSLFSIQTFSNWATRIIANTFSDYRWFFQKIIRLHSTGLLSNETWRILIGPIIWFWGILLVMFTSPIYAAFKALLLSPLWTLYAFMPLMAITMGISLFMTLSFFFTLLIVPLFLEPNKIVEIIQCNKEIIIFALGLAILISAFRTLTPEVSGAMTVGLILVTIYRCYLFYKKYKSNSRTAYN